MYNIWYKVTYFPHLDRMSKPAIVKHVEATIDTTSAKAYTGLGKLKYFWIFFSPLSITGASAAAPATQNGLVTLLPAHISMTIWRAVDSQFKWDIQKELPPIQRKRANNN